MNARAPIDSLSAAARWLVWILTADKSRPRSRSSSALGFVASGTPPVARATSSERAKLLEEGIANCDFVAVPPCSLELRTRADGRPVVERMNVSAIRSASCSAGSSVAATFTEFASPFPSGARARATGLGAGMARWGVAEAEVALAGIA
nr:hypothetical protein [Paraliomyxa miuraensis]